VNGGKSSLSEQNHLLSPAMIEKKEEDFIPKNNDALQYIFFSHSFNGG